ncbi:CLAVATA3/ESR [Hirschfeldia incana]|nr:CLAVATA3/ESR [Hirschfeldia incana]
MRRHAVIINLLLLTCHFLGIIVTWECQKDQFISAPEKIGTKTNYERVMPTWVEEKAGHKHPSSGPNPSGNRHPPAKVKP